MFIPIPAILLACTPQDGTSDPSTGPTNVLLVILDDVGVDHVGAYGLDPAAPPTPTLDALAADGMVFDRAYAMPTCTATRAALMTGRHNRRTQMGSVLWTDTDDEELSLDEITLPEVLHTAPIPYRSEMAGKWHLSTWDSPSAEDHPRASGFDWFAGSFGNLFYATDGEPVGYFDWEKIAADGSLERTTTYATTDTVDDTIDRLDQIDAPFLFVASLNSAHTPLHRPPDDLYTVPADTDVEKFDAMVESLDTELGRLLDAMDPDVRDHTLILVFGDNGTPEHAVTEPFHPDRAKGTVYEGGIRVPFVAVGPQVPPGTHTDAMVSVVDLLPTLADLAGVDLPEVLGGVAIDGTSFLPVLSDPDAPGREWIYVEDLVPVGPGPYTSDDRAIRDDRYKLIRHLSGSEEFYDLDGLSFEEGEDLVPGGPPDDDTFAAYERLSAELDAIAIDLAGG